MQRSRSGSGGVRGRCAPVRRAAVYWAKGLEGRVLLSSAIAAFGAQQTFGAGSQPRSVAVADVNSDGKLDLLVANGAGNSAGVVLGDGNGTFLPQGTFGVGNGAVSVAAAGVKRG